MTEANSGHPPTDRAVAYEQLLAAYLAERDVPCNSCGYNLRGAASGSCPECGKEITISLSRPDEATLAWFIAIIVYAMALCISGIYALVLGLIFFIESMDADMGVAATVSFGVLVVALTVLVMLIHRRHAMWRMSPLKQWLIAASVLLLPVLAAVGIAIGLAIFT